jgi:hypothetical protein
MEPKKMSGVRGKVMTEVDRRWPWLKQGGAARREQAVRVGGEEDDLNRKVGHHSWFL